MKLCKDCKHMRPRRKELGEEGMKTLDSFYRQVNGIPIVINPEYLYRFKNLEPRKHLPPYMVMMPKIEVYTYSLKSAINHCKDRRRINGQKRRGFNKLGF